MEQHHTLSLLRIFLLLVFAFLIAVLSALGTYFVLNKQSPQVQTLTDSKIHFTTLETNMDLSTWDPYYDTSIPYGFTFKVPHNWNEIKIFDHPYYEIFFTPKLPQPLRINRSLSDLIPGITLVIHPKDNEKPSVAPNGFTTVTHLKNVDGIVSQTTNSLTKAQLVNIKITHSPYEIIFLLNAGNIKNADKILQQLIDSLTISSVPKNPTISK